MALSRRFDIPFEVAFPEGLYLISEVERMIDFDKSTQGDQGPAGRPRHGLADVAGDLSRPRPGGKEVAEGRDGEDPGQGSAGAAGEAERFAAHAGGARGSFGHAMDRRVGDLLEDLLVVSGQRARRTREGSAACGIG